MITPWLCLSKMPTLVFHCLSHRRCVCMRSMATWNEIGKGKVSMLVCPACGQGRHFIDIRHSSLLPTMFRNSNYARDQTKTKGRRKDRWSECCATFVCKMSRCVWGAKVLTVLSRFYMLVIEDDETIEQWIIVIYNCHPNWSCHPNWRNWWRFNPLHHFVLYA